MMSINKYTLGTIVGTALLPLLKGKGSKSKIGIGKKLVSTILNTLYLTPDQVEAYHEAVQEHPNLFHQIEMKIKQYLVNQDSSYDDIIVEIEFEEVDPDENLYNICIYLKTFQFFDPSKISHMGQSTRIMKRAYSEKRLSEALAIIPLEHFLEFDFIDDESDTDSFFVDQLYISTNEDEWSLYEPKNIKTNLRRR